MGDYLVFEGTSYFRQRLVLSTLSGRPTKFTDIRALNEEPGLKDFEIRLLKLLDMITNGTKVEINETGTELIFEPGFLQGGKHEFDCGVERNISYFLELLIYLAPFVKKPLNLKLSGCTNSQKEPAVDVMKAAFLPVFKKFVLDSEGLDIKILKRGLPPGGGGEVVFTSPLARQLRPIQLLKQGKIKKIRGWAFACKCSPVLMNRMVEAAKKLLKNLLSDIYIYTDHRKGAAGGNSPGFGLILTAETNEGTIFVGESMSNLPGENPAIPEEIGEKAASKLLEEIYRGGCCDSSAQGLTALFMTLGQKDVSKALIGPLSNYSIHFLRGILAFFNVKFKLEPVPMEEEKQMGGDKLMMICVGAGFSNINKTLI